MNESSSGGVRFVAIAPGHYGLSADSADEARKHLRGAGYSRRVNIIVVELVPPQPSIQVHELYGPMLPSDIATRVVHDSRPAKRRENSPRPFAHTLDADAAE